MSMNPTKMPVAAAGAAVVRLMSRVPCQSHRHQLPHIVPLPRRAKGALAHAHGYARYSRKGSGGVASVATAGNIVSIETSRDSLKLI